MRAHRAARAQLAALACALTLALAGCSHDVDTGEPASMNVNGEFGQPVTLSVKGTVEVPEDVTADVLIEGEGAVIVENGPVLMRATSFDSRTGEVISDYNTGEIRMTTADVEGVGDLAPQLIGHKEGTRLLVKRGGLAGRDSAEIIVVDILSTSATGQAVALPDPLPAGMPTIETLDSGAPHVAAGNGRIHALAAVPLSEGAGEQVGINDTVIIQYIIVDTQANLIDTTWNGLGPVTVSLADVMQGLQEGLADQKVGSRVAVLIPSSQASGEGDRIAVVDILAISRNATEK